MSAANAQAAGGDGANAARLPSKKGADTKAEPSTAWLYLTGVGGCLCDSVVGIITTFVGGFAVYAGIEWGATKCATDIPKATLAAGIALLVYAFFSMLTAITGLCNSVFKRDPKKMHAHISDKSIVGRVVKTLSSFTGGAAVALLAWLAYETFRDNMWARMHTAGATECDGTLYQIVSIALLAVGIVLVLWLLGYLLTIALVCVNSGKAASAGKAEEGMGCTKWMATRFGLEEAYTSPESLRLLGAEEDEEDGKQS